MVPPNKAECDALIETLAAGVIGPSGYEKQKKPRWIRAEGHFFAEIRVPWSRGYYSVHFGIGCDVIPYYQGWKRPRRQTPGHLEANFLLDEPGWRGPGRHDFASDPLLHPQFSLDKAGDLLVRARDAIERKVRWPITKASFIAEFQQNRAAKSALPFYAGVDNVITDYVLLRSRGADVSAAAERLIQIYKADTWRPMLDTAADQFAKLSA